MIDLTKVSFPGITIGGKHTWTDYRLFMYGSPSIGAPDVQSTLMQVPGRDGLLRLTKALDGTVHYYNRDFSATFYPNDRGSFVDTVTEIMGAVHGQTLQMIVDHDSDYYYTGEFYVEPDYENCTLTITGSLDPYKTNSAGEKSL